MEKQNQLPKKRKSRIFQFGIRTLLVLIVVSSLVTRFGFLSWQQKEAIKEIRTYGGAVFLSHQSPVYDYPAMFGAPNKRP